VSSQKVWLKCWLLLQFPPDLYYWVNTCMHVILSKYVSNTHTHTIVLRPSWILSGTTRVIRYQEAKPISWFTGARDSESQCHQLVKICTLTQIQQCENATTQFLQARRPSCCPTNSVKALKAIIPPDHTHTHNRFTAGLEYVWVHPGQQVPER